MTQLLQVRRDAITTAELATIEPRPLVDGEVRVSVGEWALTANNISYALTGNTIGYWTFYPAPGGEEWGIVPVWGFAEVSESRHDDVPVGTRFWGFLPMASDWVMQPVKVSDRGFIDGAPHRAAMAAVYNQYQRTNDDAPAMAAFADQRSLLFPLLFTGWVIGDYLVDNGHFGADRVIIGSASSKTGFGAAHYVRELAGREIEVVGLTSAGNVTFVEGLGLYDKVLTYDAAETLDAAVPTAYVDMAGDAALRSRLHHHFGEQMKASITVGATHWQATGPEGDLPGAKPQFFFAPGQIAKRQADWGPGVVDRKVLEANLAFLPRIAGTLRIRHEVGEEAVAAAYAAMVAGKVPPDEGLIVSFG